MKLKPTLAAFAVAVAVLAQPALAGFQFTQNEKGEVTHYNGIPMPPIQTIEEAKAQAQKEIAAAKKAREAEQAAAASSSNLQSEIGNQQLFFTGKPYLEETGQYLFRFRHYDPELARWSTSDPSGFPDGANNIAYMAVPTSEFDWQGLLVSGTYSITKRILTLNDEDGRTRTWKNLQSGNNKVEDQRVFNVGPIPIGNYSLFTRDKWNATYSDHPAFILDPNDNNPLNDIWDGHPEADGRYGFRIHIGGGTAGCITMSSNALSILVNWLQQTQYDSDNLVTISSPPDPGTSITSFTEFRLGTLNVVE